ncbi:MAG: molecular chaperone TorD family protein, partial [Spirochaetales bacterium]|nr:molecular chaperone TorD family protein [Candidatus Physcosoma equi]
MDKTMTREEFLSLLHDTFWKRSDNEEYSALFEFTDSSIIVPLWESSYWDDMKILLDGTTFTLVEAYAASGLIVQDPSQPADYIGYELEYYIYLYNRKEYNLLNSFYKEHLSRLLDFVFTR